MVHSEEADAKAKAQAKAKAKDEFMTSLKHLVESRKPMTSKPDLSMEELAMIMTLCRPKGVTAIELQKMIIRCLPYYAEMACDAGIRGFSQDMRYFNAEFTRVFQQFEIPWTRGGVPADAPNLSFDPRIAEFIAADTQSTWTIEWEEAEILFQRRLGYRAAYEKEVFTFLDLPAELRNRIYEMVVGFPRSGVSIEPGQPEARLMSRNYEEPLDLDRWKTRILGTWPSLQYCNAVMYSRPLHDMLAIFRLSKQIYREIMPIFYGSNVFICQDISHLAWFLGCLEEATRKELKHIVLFLRAKNNSSPMLKALKLLRSCTGLQKLDIVLEEQDFLARLTDKKGNQKYQDMMQVPGIVTLAEMRGLQVVNFHGHCDGLKAILEPLLLQPKTSS